MNKEITIIVNGAGYIDFYQPKITIYDINNNCFYDDYTYNGLLKIVLKSNNFYHVKINLFSETINGIIYVNNFDDKYIFSFNHALINNNASNIITFLLTDSNYAYLPIESGEVILWQKQLP